MPHPDAPDPTPPADPAPEPRDAEAGPRRTDGADPPLAQVPDRPRERAAADREALLDEPATECRNCGRDLPGAYCPSCGQKAGPLRQPVHRFVVDAFVEFFGIDGRVWPTLAALVVKPGTLTREYLAGRRQTYLRPLRVYLVSTLLFFFLLSIVDPISRVGDDVFNSSDRQTVRVADRAADLDSLLAAGFAPLDDERRDARAYRADVDSLALLMSAPGVDLESDLEDAHDDLEDALEELRSDSLDRVAELRRARLERAMLATMPPDSLVELDVLRGAANLVYPDSTPLFTGAAEDWLLRNESLRGMSDAPTNAQKVDHVKRFLRTVIGYVPTVLFIVLPVFALLLKVLYVRRGWYYSEHLIFGLHTHAFAFVVFSLATLIALAATRVPGLGGVLVALFLSIPLYFYVAQKRVYGQGWIKTAAKAVVLSFAYLMVLSVGLVAIFVFAAFLG